MLDISKQFGNAHQYIVIDPPIIVRINENLDPSESTTRDLVESAAESARAKRRRLRAEREANEQLELERRNKYDEYYNVAGTGLIGLDCED